MGGSNSTFTGEFKTDTFVRHATITFNNKEHSWECVEEMKYSNPDHVIRVTTKGSFKVSEENDALAMTVHDNFTEDSCVTRFMQTPPTGQQIVIPLSVMKAGGPISSTFQFVRHSYTAGKRPAVVDGEELRAIDRETYVGVAGDDMDDDGLF